MFSLNFSENTDHTANIGIEAAIPIDLTNKVKVGMFVQGPTIDLNSKTASFKGIGGNVGLENVPGLSTEATIMCLKDTVRYYTDRQTPVYACFLDLSKAFDLICYDKLWGKLERAGVPGNIIDIFRYCAGYSVDLSAQHKPDFGSEVGVSAKYNFLEAGDHKVAANVSAKYTMPNTGENFTTLGAGVDYRYKGRVGATAGISYTPESNEIGYTFGGNATPLKSPYSSVDFGVNARYKKGNWAYDVTGKSKGLLIIN